MVPQLEWRSLDRWRAVASKSGLRLMALSSDGGPAAFVEESRGRRRRVPMEGLLSGYSARVRIVDHVSAFQAVRSCLRVDERLAILVPQIAVGIRRLHDTGKSGWTVLWALIPILGGLYLLYLLIQPGEAGTNEYGPEPTAPPSIA